MSNFTTFVVPATLDSQFKLTYIMGKGDKKSKRGKIIRGSFGVRRKRKANKSVVAALPKVALKDTEKAAVTVTAETKAPKPVKTARPKAPAKSAAKPAATKAEKEPTATKAEKEPAAVKEKAAKPAAKAKKPAAKKEE